MHRSEIIYSNQETILFGVICNDREIKIENGSVCPKRDPLMLRSTAF